MSKHGLSVLILVKNAESTLKQTLESCGFADEIIILNDGSVDNSMEIASHFNVRVIAASEQHFAQKRNRLLREATYDWVIYVDADEVIPASLAKEIEDIVLHNIPGVYAIKRRNYFLGKEMYLDQVERLFHATLLTEWQGEVHEHAVLKVGIQPQQLKQPLLHHTHRSIDSMLAKTNEWSEIEAQLRIEANHPPVAWWRLLRMGMTTFIAQYLGKKLYRYGREGLFESYFQAIDKMIVYTKLWEKQHNHARMHE